MKRILVLASILVLAACGEGDKKTTTTDPIPALMGPSTHSDTFNLAFSNMLSSYFQWKDQFIAENDTLITRHTQQLIMDIAAVAMVLHELQPDSNVVSTARNYTTGLSSELKGVYAEKNLEERRRAFQVVSEQLYDLIRTVKYDRAVIYHQYCPMALNDAGAYWLSNASDIRNPYLPKTMLECGEVQDSVDFRKP